MYHIAYKNSDKKVICLRETEEQCWMTAKGMDSDAFNIWKESLRDEDGKLTFPSADFTVVRINQNLKSPVSEDEGAKTYNDYIIKRNNVHFKWNTTKKELEPDDSSLAAAELDQKWAEIRRRRNRLLTESDWVVVKAKETHANASISSDWVDYRTELRDITKQSDPDDITWPTKPS